MVSFIDISNNKNFVLKRIKALDLEEQILLIFDYVANIIANNSNINVLVPKENYLINKKFINQGFCKDQYYDRIALLQSLAFGTSISEASDIDLHQRSKRSNKYEHIYGKLKLKNTGLTRKIIQNMSLHEDLIKLVAFDTFINNSDRSNPNIIYDQNNNRYYGIDHLAAFADRDLSSHALRQISSFMKCLNKKEKATLCLYKNTLEKLYNNFPPEKIIELIDSYLDRYFPEYKLDRFASEKINKIYSNIKKNYVDTKKLLDYLVNL